MGGPTLPTPNSAQNAHSQTANLQFRAEYMGTIQVQFELVWKQKKMKKKRNPILLAAETTLKCAHQLQRENTKTQDTAAL
jgi:hypothetical protein